MKEYYFEDSESEVCYTKQYFIDYMTDHDITEMELLEAEPEKMDGIFWCSKQLFCGDGSEETCGKQCNDYEPRNGKSGCCRFYTTTLYIHGKKITLKL